MTLLDRIRAATGPDRELDAEIHKVLGWELAPPEAGAAWWNKNGDTYGHRDIPRYTGSMNATKTLLPDDVVAWTVGDSPAGPTAWLLLADGREFNGFPHPGKGTPETALCDVAIQAIQETQDD